MSHFDEEIKLQTQAPGRYTRSMPDSWNIGTVPNGGYLMTLAVRALTQQVPQHPDPFSVTVHYLRPAVANEPCQIDAQILRTGATLSTGRATLSQQDKSRLEVLAAFGNLEAGAQAGGQTAAQTSTTIAAPDAPPPEQCIVRSSELQGVDLPIMNRLDIRLHPNEFRASPAGKPQMTGWIRFKDGRPPDSLSLLLFADSFPPAIFGLIGMVGWVPTIELTVHVRRRPAPGWILGQFRTHDLADGRMIEDGALWDSSGALVAQSRQLAMLRRRD